MASFSERDLLLLRTHFQFYFDLDSGHRQPTTDKQHHFVRVCRNVDNPITEHEAAYLRLKEVARNLECAVDEIANANFELPIVPEDGFEIEMRTIEVRLCSRCKKPIHPERMEAIPNATRCVKCQGVAESLTSNSPVTTFDCPRCLQNGFHSRLVWRIAHRPNNTDFFLGCSRFPDCRYTES